MKGRCTHLTEGSILSAGIWLVFKEGETKADNISALYTLSRVCEAYHFFNMESLISFKYIPLGCSYNLLNISEYINVFFIKEQKNVSCCVCITFGGLINCLD